MADLPGDILRVQFRAEFPVIIFKHLVEIELVEFRQQRLCKYQVMGVTAIGVLRGAHVGNALKDLKKGRTLTGQAFIISIRPIQRPLAMHALQPGHSLNAFEGQGGRWHESVKNQRRFGPGPSPSQAVTTRPTAAMLSPEQRSGTSSTVCQAG